jgi:DNA-binding response OmpR family regulator
MEKCGKPKNILVVDDDAIIAELVKSILYQAGFQTHIARSGRVDLECIYNMHLNGMVLDLGLPDLDGFSILSEMHNNNYIMKIPTLILSGNYALNNVKRAIHLGAKDYIAKPFNDKQLISRVMRLVHEQQGVKLGEDVIYI